MSQDEVLSGFAEVLRAVAGLDPADVTLDKSLAGDLGLDSLVMVEVVVAAEDRFGVLIDDHEWSRFKTVADATRYVEQAAAGTL
jgi:acyl carrier protein